MTAIQKEITIGNCRLILGDMRDVLPQLDVRADLIVTDPPYLLNSGGNAQETMGGIFSHAKYANTGALMDVLPWHEMGGPLFRACAKDADCYVMANDKNVIQAGNAFMGAGWELHNLLVWDKARATRNRWYMKNLEFTLYFWKGNADDRKINDCGSKQLFKLNEPRHSEHPTEKPVALFSHYILNSSQKGDLVLDPFMGSGSTLVAAAQTGRHAIGIEKKPMWFDVACARVAETMNLSQSAEHKV